MSGARIAAVTIGQAPRPDLLEPLLERMGPDHELMELGALDGLTSDGVARLAARAASRYPLTTRLADGSPVTLDEQVLAPLVQEAIDRAEGAGAEVTLLLCAGGFSDAIARGTLVRPFEAAVARLRQLGARALAVVVPFAGQADPARLKWEAAGFEVATLVGDPVSVDLGEVAERDAIVLDYVGHAAGAVEQVRMRTSIRVVDLGEAGVEAAIALLAGQPRHHAAAGR